MVVLEKGLLLMSDFFGIWVSSSWFQVGCLDGGLDGRRDAALEPSNPPSPSRIHFRGTSLITDQPPLGPKSRL